MVYLGSAVVVFCDTIVVNDDNDTVLRTLRTALGRLEPSAARDVQRFARAQNAGIRRSDCAVACRCHVARRVHSTALGSLGATLTHECPGRSEIIVEAGAQSSASLGLD
jgi:hypothetical protein